MFLFVFYADSKSGGYIEIGPVVPEMSIRTDVAPFIKIHTMELYEKMWQNFFECYTIFVSFFRMGMEYVYKICRYFIFFIPCHSLVITLM